MAGGIFANYPFELNAKCVIFSLIIIGIFFYSPPNMSIAWQLMISFILFIVAYVAMAWYDYQFQCTKLALKKSASGLGITGKFKPEAHTESQLDRTKMTPEEIRLDYILITLLHLLIISPLLLYIGIRGNQSTQVSIIVLIMVSAFAIIYHGVRLLRAYNDISLGHVIMGAVIIGFSIMKTRPDYFYYALIFTSIYTALKHGSNLIKISH